MYGVKIHSNLFKPICPNLNTWNVQAEDGKRKGRCAGNGSVNALEKKSAKESSEKREVSKNE